MEDTPKHPSIQYFLQVLKNGEDPKWPEADEELLVGKQSLDGGYTQYWAYPKSFGKEPEDLPSAEVLAGENQTSAPAILIDQKGEGLLQLVLVKDSHAWIHTESSVNNLEDNITAVVEEAREKYGFKVEHFLTTSRVAPEVEHRLDKLEQNGNPGEESQSQGHFDSKMPQAAHDSTPPMVGDDSLDSEVDDGPYIKHLATIKEEGLWSSHQAQHKPSDKKARVGWATKLAILIPIVLVGMLFVGVFSLRGKSMPKLSWPSFSKVEMTPTPLPTQVPTPTPIPFDRSKIKVRVLNGTTKAGAAGALADDLKSKGWNVLSKGNAKNQSLAQTQISLKQDLEQAVLDKIMDDLKGSFEATKGADLSSTDKADIEVVIGKK